MAKTPAKKQAAKTPATSGHNRPPEDVDRLVQAVREALSDQMVERLATTAGNGLEVADRLNDEETRDAVHFLIDKVTELHRIGALGTLFETVLLVHAMRSAATDSIVERLFEFAENMVNNLGNEDTVALVGNLQTSMAKAAEDAAATPARGGLLATVSMLSKPETQQSLQFLLNLGTNLRKAQTG